MYPARPPQRLAPVLTGAMLDSLLGDPVIRLAGTSRKGYTGGALQPQTFLRPPSFPNEAEQVELAANTVSNARRAINRTRSLR